MSNTIALGDAVFITVVVLVSFWSGVLAERSSVKDRLRNGLPVFERKRTTDDRHTRSHYARSARR
jgi:hypothetical protein